MGVASGSLVSARTRHDSQGIQCLNNTITKPPLAAKESEGTSERRVIG